MLTSKLAMQRSEVLLGLLFMIQLVGTIGQDVERLAAPFQQHHQRHLVPLD